MDPQPLQLVHDTDPPLNVHAARAQMIAERAQATRDVGLQFAIIKCLWCEHECDGTGVTAEQATNHAISALIRHVVACHERES